MRVWPCHKTTKDSEGKIIPKICIGDSLYLKRKSIFQVLMHKALEKSGYCRKGKRHPFDFSSLKKLIFSSSLIPVSLFLLDRFFFFFILHLLLTFLCCLKQSPSIFLHTFCHSTNPEKLKACRQTDTHTHTHTHTHLQSHEDSIC